MKLPWDGGIVTSPRNTEEGREPVAIVVVTASSSVKTAVEAIKCGADDYLTKPINIEELKLVLGKGIWEKTVVDCSKQDVKRRN